MIGIIGAMQTEVELLISKIEEAEKRTVSGIDFFSGRIENREVVVAKCGIGKVFAAICAQTMILEYGVSLIINTGVGGAISDELEIGDIAVSSAVVQHDMDTSAIGDPVGLISGINIIEIPADKRTADIVMAAADKLSFRCLSGIVASGDRFVAGAENKKKISDAFGALVCEMEGAAIGQVCYVNEVPFLVVRAVSDKADGTSGVDYMTFVATAAKKNARLVLEALKNI